MSASDFFEAVYAGAERDEASVPWQQAMSRPMVAEWMAAQPPVEGARALVVAAGLGDDAASLAERGYRVVAFDHAPSAVAWARERHPEAEVDWQVADLLAPPAQWADAFDLVLEVFTVQSIPRPDAAAAAERIRGFVAQGGRLVAVALVTDDPDPDGPPWPLHDDLLAHLLGDLEVTTRTEAAAGERTRCVLVEARRP